MALIAMTLILLGFVLTHCDHALYGDYCMAILAAGGMYKAANVFDGRKRDLDSESRITNK